MNRTTNFLASIGLAVGAIFGVSGSVITEPTLQIALYEISSIGLLVACVLLAIKFIRQKNDFIGTGFLLFAIGEAVMSAGVALGQMEGQASFGAGMALYVPALLFISIPKGFPLWTRITGVAASIPFTIAASTIFLGGQALSSSPVVGAGYGLLVLTNIGWILTLIKEKEVESQSSQKMETTFQTSGL